MSIYRRSLSLLNEIIAESISLANNMIFYLFDESLKFDSYNDAEKYFIEKQ